MRSAKHLLMGPVLFAGLIGCGENQRQSSSTKPAEPKNAKTELSTQPGGPTPPTTRSSPVSYKPVTLITPAEMEVPASLPFKQQVEKHAEILQKLTDVMRQTEARKKTAKDANSLSDYLSAEQDETNAIHFLSPYAIGQAREEEMTKAGYKMKNWEGTACNEQGQCSHIDPITAVFFLLGGFLVDELNKKEPFGPNNDLVKFLQYPLGGPNSELVKIREMLLAHDQNGEIAKLIRDPIKRPVEIIQNARDKIIPPSDNGDIARAIRDPVNCTVGKLWGQCK